MQPAYFVLSALKVEHPGFFVEVNRYSVTHSQTLTDVYPDPSVTGNTET